MCDANGYIGGEKAQSGENYAGLVGNYYDGAHSLLVGGNHYDRDELVAAIQRHQLFKSVCGHHLADCEWTDGAGTEPNSSCRPKYWRGWISRPSCCSSAYMRYSALSKYI